ncbi:MAG: hypothetical protein QM820_46635 [Minicystis sp.]
MDDDLGGFHDDPGWVAAAAHLEPIAPEPPRRKRSPDARRALALGILGVACLGFVFGPLALALGQRARLAMLADREPREADDVGMAHAAITLGKVGLALHLTILASVIPWLLFVLPLVANSGR